MKELISHGSIEQKIFTIREQRVMLDRDLAELYGVSTKVLNQAVKRNINRFPGDFMFRLKKEEKEEVVTNCDHLRVLKFSPQLPYAFTEHGILMLSSVLNSERAIQVNVAIMRVFVKTREMLSTHKEIACKLHELERRIGKHDVGIQTIFEVIRRLITPPLIEEKPKRRIGFHAD